MIMLHKTIIFISLGLVSNFGYAMNVKSKAEKKELTPEKRQELLQTAAQATQSDKNQLLALEFFLSNESQRSAVFNFWLTQGADINVISVGNCASFQILGYLDGKQRTDKEFNAKKLKQLLSWNADPNQLQDGKTPLQTAIECNFFEAIEILLADSRTNVSQEESVQIEGLREKFRLLKMKPLGPIHLFLRKRETGSLKFKGNAKKLLVQSAAAPAFVWPSIENSK